MMLFPSTPRVGSLLLLIAATATVVSSYDVGCLYPEDAPDDLFQARKDIIIGRDIRESNNAGRETPVVIHSAHEKTMCQAACTAYHTPGMLDPITMQRQFFVVPEFGQNGYSIIMCIAQCSLYGEAGFPQNTKPYDTELPSRRPDIREAWEKCEPNPTTCAGPCQDICDLIIGSDFDPYMVGHWLGVRISNYFDADGWNRKGDMTWDIASDGPAECTGSCRKYQDTYGYDPVPDPRTDLLLDPFKYECEGNCRHWQPLQEGTPEGSLLRQEFITPHIGYHAKTYLRNATLTLDDPEYDLYNASLQVVEELKMASSDPYKKEQIKLMDDKLLVRYVIQEAITNQFATTGEMSFQEFTVFLFGISTAEIDGVVQAWKEKVHHDMVRPTTVIKHWDDDDLLTFGGDRDMDGPVTIKARDFEAFIRVMPHGEFPSGSSCLCKLYQEFTDTYLTGAHGRTITNFSNDFNTKVYDNMEELLSICGNSRVWAGLHYPPAVPAGEEICSGLGSLAVNYVTNLMNGVDFVNKWHIGTERPVCGE